MSTPTRCLHMTAPSREDFDIPYHDFGPQAERAARRARGGPARQRAERRLRAVAAGRRSCAASPTATGPGRSSRGRVIVIPAVNVLGVNTRSRRWPFDGTDINRMFPGYDAGETTQRIAAAVLAAHRAPRAGASTSTARTSTSRSCRRCGSTSRPTTSAQRRAARPAGGRSSARESATYQATLGQRLAHAAAGANFVDPGRPRGRAAAGALRAPVPRAGRLPRAARRARRRASRRARGRRAPLRPAPDLPADLRARRAVRVAARRWAQWLQAGDLIGYVYDGFERRAARRDAQTPVGRPAVAASAASRCSARAT